MLLSLRAPISLILMSCLLISCAQNKDKDELSSEQKLYQNAQSHLKARRWDLAIETLQALEDNFPFGAYAEQSQLELIYAYHQSFENDAAIAAAERFIRLHPQHRDVDYAYYMRGLASFTKDQSFFSNVFGVDLTQRDPGGSRESFEYFDELIKKFPNSQHAADAQKRMIYLRNLLARSEIHIANYYFERGAYLAAAKRGRYVVENFQGTPAVPDGLAVMAQAYNLVGMPELSDNAIRVLATNFPNHPALDEAGHFNFEYGIDDSAPSWVNYLTLGLFKKRNTVKYDSREIYNPIYQDEPADESNENIKQTEHRCKSMMRCRGKFRKR